MEVFKKLDSTNELKFVVSYMTESLSKEFRTNTLCVELYIVALLEVKHCWARRVLDNIMLSETMSMLGEWCSKTLTAAAREADTGIGIHFEPLVNACMEELAGRGQKVSTCTLLLSILTHSKALEEEFNKLGVTKAQIEEGMLAEMEDFDTDHIDTDLIITPAAPVETEKPSKRDEKKGRQKQHQQAANNDVERNLININRLDLEGKVDEIIGNEEVFEKIFTTFLKKDRNNICLVGEPGCGKTSTVKYLATLINSKNVPEYFRDKQLAMFDFVSMTAGTGFRGGFEGKYKAIVDAASKSKNYIFFIDDIHSILQPNSKFTEMSTDSMLDYILGNNEIGFICTTTYEGYSKYIEPNKALARRMEKIELKENKEDLPSIMRRICEKYEAFHGMEISDEVIAKAISLSDRYLGKSSIDIVSDILDTASAIEYLAVLPDDTLASMERHLDEIQALMYNFNDEEHYEEFDALASQEIQLRAQISTYKKKAALNKVAIPVTEDSLYKAVSAKSGIKVGSLSMDERSKLQQLASNIKKEVVGQDTAVDTVCRAVRRQRVGVGNPDKPTVLLFAGSTGCGKSFLAKQLAKHVYGSESNMVRLDMSEYADKMSINKLTGASAGYIGYDDGGILTEAIKKKSHCVVLLDEIEKADEEVFNTFLQVFDEGRLTDNKGVTVSFKNTIIIMTSNIGSKEASEGGHSIGFGAHDDNLAKSEIINKAIKKKLKPEFINRIDDIVMFSTLTENDLRNIIRLEIKKVEQRLNKIGFKLAKNILDGPIVETVFQDAVKQKEYGARPILRSIQKHLEDKVTDYIIDKNPKEGYTFKLKDIYVKRQS